MSPLDWLKLALEGIQYAHELRKLYKTPENDTATAAQKARKDIQDHREQLRKLREERDKRLDGQGDGPS